MGTLNTHKYWARLHTRDVIQFNNFFFLFLSQNDMRRKIHCWKSCFLVNLKISFDDRHFKRALVFLRLKRLIKWWLLLVFSSFREEQQWRTMEQLMSFSHATANHSHLSRSVNETFFLTMHPTRDWKLCIIVNCEIQSCNRQHKNVT